MDTISVPRRHSSCSMSNSVTPPRSPIFLINRASPVPDENAFYGTSTEGLGDSLNVLYITQYISVAFECTLKILKWQQNVKLNDI